MSTQTSNYQINTCMYTTIYTYAVYINNDTKFVQSISKYTTSIKKERFRYLIQLKILVFVGKHEQANWKRAWCKAEKRLSQIWPKDYCRSTLDNQTGIAGSYCSFYLGEIGFFPLALVWGLVFPGFQLTHPVPQYNYCFHSMMHCEEQAL